LIAVVSLIPSLIVSIPPADSHWSVLDPCTETTITTLALATAADVDAAVSRAKKALPTWTAVTTQDRARLLRRFADAVANDGENLAQIESRNCGKPIDGARWEAGAAADCLHFFASAVERHHGKTLPWNNGLTVTLHEPLGVVGAITPWNFPMLIAAWKIGPALACGNTLLLKPSELTPLTALRLGELALEAGLPEGVLEIVVGTGNEAGQRMLDHRDIAKIGFTGSTAVGKHIMRTAADSLKRVTLELGGKSANIVFADADLEAAAAAIPGSIFDNSGQDCCARSRILVEQSVHDRFVEMVVDVSRGVKVGTPNEPGVVMGPLISAAHRAKVASFEGDGDVAFVGDVPEGPGFWYPPTVVTGVDRRSRMAQEEIFGPVVCVLPFSDEADAAALANDTVFGLSGSIWSRDGSKALRMARAVQSGTLSVNSNSSVRYSTPFGGFKQSGVGRDLSDEALGHWSETKTVFIATS
jgi:acyl-CoA reductase-like NAD-dependent aldehyde dehydrogenase